MEGFRENLPPEEIVDDGLGLLIRQKRLYHGSGKKGIEHLNSAEETTVGEGIYFTSEKTDAQGYANRRSRRNEADEPIVYGTQIENLKFLDLRNLANEAKILEGFKSTLVEERKKNDLPWYYEEGLDNAISLILNNKVRSLREITFTHGKLFTEYVKSLGYDGLITVEGGEGDDIGTHDTYLVFDPDKVKGLSIED